MLRTRFSDEVIVGLLHVRWWDWPDEKVQDAMPPLLNGDVGRFLAQRGARTRRHNATEFQSPPRPRATIPRWRFGRWWSVRDGTSG